MGWIELGDGLVVYSLTDDLVMMFEWLMEFLTTMSPYMYTLFFIGFVAIILLGIAYKVHKMGERVVSK